MWIIQTAKRSKTEQHRAATFKGCVCLPVQLLHERRARDALRAVHLLPTLPRVQSRRRPRVRSGARGGGACRPPAVFRWSCGILVQRDQGKTDMVASVVSGNALSHWPKPPHCSDVTLHTSKAAREVQQHDPRRVVHGALQIVHR